MNESQIRFDDGAAYEQMMGIWSQLAGEVFLDWLKPAPGLRWIDVGCGNGAFTELIVSRCAPSQCTASIRPRRSSLLRGRGRGRAARSLRRATPWRCRSPRRV